MTLFIIWLIGALVAVFLPKQIVKLAYLTLKIQFVDDGKKFFDKENDDDFPVWLYISFTAGLSWLSVIAIYITSIIHLLINKHSNL
jgi:hypothetical protein